jgi:hypothetical protein
MPLNSVQQYCKGLLDGLPLPGQDQPLIAHIMPPTMEEMDGPRAYVWGARMRGERQTAPRRAGYKRLPWTVDVYLAYLDSADNPDGDKAFPLIIDAVLARFWSTTMPLMITDPETGQVSQILAVGETWDLEYPPERLPATMRMIWSVARLSMDVTEAIQA